MKIPCMCLVFAAVIVFVWSAETSFAQQVYDPFASNNSTTGTRDYGVISSVEFVDTPITTIFRMVSDLTGWSIVMSPEVSAKPPKINIWIKNLTPDQVLNQVATLGGLVMNRDGTTVNVMTFDEYSRLFGVKQQVIALKFARPRDVVEILKPFTDKAGQARIVPDEVGCKVILLLPEPLMTSAKTLIEAVDIPGQQEQIKIISLKHIEASEIVKVLAGFLAQGGSRGISSVSVAGKPSSTSSRSGTWDLTFIEVTDLNLLLLRGPSEYVKRAEEIIARLDIPSGIYVTSYELKYTNAAEVYNTIQGILGSGGDVFSESQATSDRLKISLSSQNNRIVVEGSAKDHERISVLINSIDLPLSGGRGGTRVYRLENASAAEVVKVIKELIREDEQEKAEAKREGGGAPPGVSKTRGSLTASSSGAGSGASIGGSQGGDASSAEASTEDVRARVTAAPEINAVVIKASTADHAEFARIIEEMDQPRDQVVLEVTLVLVMSDRTFDLGIELGGNASIGNVDIVGFTTFGIGDVDPSTGAIRTSDPPPLGFNFNLFNALDFSILLNALETVGEIRIQSAPKILIEDNAKATISQFDQEPYETTSQGESSTVTSFGGFVDAGVELNAVPHISKHGWLRLDYEVSLSSFGIRTTSQELANLPPPRTQAIASGTVRIPAGHMVSLGGLVKKRDDNLVDSIPFLSEIPLVGELFKNRSEDSDYETLFIFIRPVLLRDPQLEDLIAIGQNDIREAGLMDEQYPQNPLKLLEPVPAGSNQ